MPVSQIETWRKRSHYHKKDKKLIMPQQAVERLYELTKQDTFITTEVGQHQMWAAQFYKFKSQTDG